MDVWFLLRHTDTHIHTQKFITTPRFSACARADLEFYKGRCLIHLKGAPAVERQRGIESGEEAVPLPIKFLYFIYQNGEFLCIPKHPVELKTCFEHIFSKKAP